MIMFLLGALAFYLGIFVYIVILSFHVASREGQPFQRDEFAEVLTNAIMWPRLIGVY